MNDFGQRILFLRHIVYFILCDVTIHSWTKVASTQTHIYLASSVVSTH